MTHARQGQGDRENPMTTPSQRSPREVARTVLEIEATAIRGLVDQLDDAFDEAVLLLRAVTGRVVCTGMGKSGLIMKKVAATLSSTGTPALFLHPAEAIHGDVGMVVEGDVVVAASYSGTTEELLRLTEIMRRLGVPIIAITGKASSPLARSADLHLRAEIDQEACPLNLAPTASTTATLALGDALAMALLEARGFTPEDFARLHPGGQLGRRLLRVRDVMHAGEEVPRVAPATPIPEALHEMSRKGLGITAIVDDEGHLLGCLADGDLRRGLETDPNFLARDAGTSMRPNPKTIDGAALASAALHEMETHHITSLFVCDDTRRLEGVIHLHDLWRLELF